jgi:hypothetical protein
MVHRLNAAVVLVLVLVACVKTVRRFGWRSGFSKGAALWSG